MADATENKVMFNLKNVYYALLTLAADGTATFATPVPVPGAVSLSMSPEGETKAFYADGIKYYTAIANNGYSGDLEMAQFPPQMRVDVWGETQGATDKVLVEKATVEPKPFALLFQIDGDQQSALNVMYNCMAARPNVGSKTNEAGKEVQTQKVKVDASPLPDGKVMASTTAGTPSETLANWFKSVFVPAA